MYKLPYHTEKDSQTVIEFIKKYPFALINGCNSAQKPVATQVPIIFEEEGEQLILRGHMMRNTDHYKAFKKNENILAVFTGPHSYISGTWYSNPYIPSTWNYMSVHVHGNIKFLDAQGLLNVLDKTSMQFEEYNANSETTLKNLPPTLISKLLNAVVAFEIEIDKIENVFKLSQDKDQKSYLNIIKELEKKGELEKALALEMNKRTQDLFD